MDTHTLLELFGYLGSALVVISMLMSSIIKLRVINTIGSVISGTYAVLCGAMPLALMNVCLVVINLWGLYKLLYNKKVSYDLVISNLTDAMTGYFIDHNIEDIKKFFPSFEKTSDTGKLAFTVCYDGTPAGILIGNAENGILNVDIDYSTPAYRDCSVGKYLYSKMSENGIKVIRFSGNETKAHEDYLLKMGFKENCGIYELKV